MPSIASLGRISTLSIFVFTMTLPILADINQAKSHSFENLSWQRFLTKYIDTTSSDGVFRVRYTEVISKDKENLRTCLSNWQKTLVSSLPKPEQQAFWINLYNAQTVATVLDHYPLKSIREIKLAGSTATGPWDTKLITIEGKRLSLNDIENGILRVQWKDNRIHFALNCASMGCPNLSTQVFTAQNMESQLAALARDFLKSTRALSLVEGKLQLSSIFDWYRSDFGGTEKTVLAFIMKYGPPETVNRLANWNGKIEYIYDWDLNAVKSTN
jgi:Protein of unknown function, DUF547